MTVTLNNEIKCVGVCITIKKKETIEPLLTDSSIQCLNKLFVRVLKVLTKVLCTWNCLLTVCTMLLLI